MVPDASGIFTLQPKATYVFRLQQRLNQRMLSDWNVHGQSTAKSSIGRMDVLARLIVDGMDCYESFRPKEMASTGDMYIEITPLTFSVLVKEGTSITQLRLFYGPPEECEFTGREVHHATVTDGASDGYLRVELSDAQVGSSKGCAFCAKNDKDSLPPPVALYPSPGGSKPEPKNYWDLLNAIKVGPDFCYLPIKKESFYILRSKERLALDGSVAVYCMAIDETIGEMRIHYAGFVHPWFGNNRDDGKTGTPLIFEVRGHDLSVHLLDNEVMARMTIYRMSMDQKRPAASPYDSQQLKLSGFFRDWPNSLRVDEQGKVSPL